MSNSGGGQRFLSLLLSLYMATVALAATFFNWEYARTHGFFRWVLFGEIVPTSKAVVWPYFVLHRNNYAGAANPDGEELRRTALTPGQISEMEVKKFIVAINYSQQATYLLNSTPHENLADYPNLSEILAYRRKAMEVGNSTDVGVLNSVYPDLGDKFKRGFLEAVTLFVHGCETQSDEELHRSKVLNDDWADWYGEHRKDIEDAANRAIGAR